MRAILGLPISEISYWGPSASAVILSDRESEEFSIRGVDRALQVKGAEIRIFGKPTTRKYRRMGIALARGKNISEARKRARLAANKVKINYF